MSNDYTTCFDNHDRADSDGNKNYLWEAQGWLCGVTTPGPNYFQYLYDNSGNRITTASRTAAGCDLNVTTLADFIVDQYGQQLMEVDGAGNWKHTNVFANGQLLATYDPNGTHFPMSDWLGNKRAQFSAVANAELYCWNMPFNDALACSGSSDATEHHYTGKEHDPYTGLDLFGARELTNYSGRFLSPDWSVQAEPVPYAKLDNPQSLNLYAYVGNNPTSGIDPDGHFGSIQQDGPGQCAANAAGNGCSKGPNDTYQPFAGQSQTPNAGQVKEARGFIGANGYDIILVNGHWQPSSTSSDADVASWWKDYNAAYRAALASGASASMAMGLLGGRIPTGSGTSLTQTQFRDLAKYEGMSPVKDISKFESGGRPVFEKGGRYFSGDTDGHSPGVWKEFDGRSGKRIGTVDLNFNRIGK